MSAVSDFDRAVALQRAGQTAEAEALCRSLLFREPEHARALHLLGTIRFTAGAAEEGIDLVRRAVSAKTDYAEAEFNLGAMLAAGGRLADATEHYGRAAALRPQDIATQSRLAAALMQLGRGTEAVAAFERVLALDPNEVAALTDLTALALQHGKVDLAVQYGQRAVAAAPGLAVAHIRLGRALKERGEREEALARYRRALELEPDSVEAGNMLAVALHELCRFDEAEAVARSLVERHPDDAASAFNLGLILQSKGEIAEALMLMRAGVERAPQRLEYRRSLAAAQLYAPDLSPQERFTLAQDLARVAASKIERPLPPPTNTPDANRKLRVGWISSDLRDHPVARNLELFFAYRDKQAFETICYADVLAQDSTTDWFREHSDGWRSIYGLSDQTVAEQIRADGIDILMHLAGRFDRNRPQIAAWRAAPVQISLFDGASSGIPEMDYFIADPVTVPPRHLRAERFAERPLRLPNFYLHFPPAEGAPPPPPPCQSVGHITFGCFNNPSKLNPRVFALWADVLRSVPGSRLYLRYREWFANKGLRERVTREFGDVADRVDFDLTNREIDQHLSLYSGIDIALDPFPFNGSTSTFEALCMGVPVVTLAGNTFMSRWTAGMLAKLGLRDLIASTSEEYIAIAKRLAGDQARLADLRATLRQRVAASVLCDGRRTTRYFERALRAVWRRWCKAANPAEQAATRYTLESDSQYLATLRQLVASGDVTVQIANLKRLREMDSPVGFQAETEQWAWAIFLIPAAVWWWFDWIGAGIALAVTIVAYATFGRWNIARRTRQRISKSLEDSTAWRALWRFGGIKLNAAQGGRTVLAPKDSWIRFVEEVLRASRARPKKNDDHPN